MAINVIGFRWGDSDENHKYDYEALENIPSTDLGVLDIDTTAEQGTDDGDLYRAIHSFSWDSVINTLSGILNVKKLFTNIVNQVKSNKDALDDPGQIVKDGIGSYSTSSSVINSDRFIIKENDGSIKQVTPLNTLKGGVRSLSTVVSYVNRYIPIISASDSSDISKTTIADAIKAGIYNLYTGAASRLNSDKSDSIVVQITPPAGSLDPVYVEKHKLSDIYNLFGIDALETRATTAESNITSLQSNKVDKTTPLLNFDDTATDPLTDDGALANALRNLGILDDVIPSGGGALYLKKVITALLKRNEREYYTLSNTTFPYLLYTTAVERIGRIATFKFAGVKNLPSKQWTDICTIPESFRPSMTMEQVYPLQANGAGTALLLSIQPTGVIRAYNYTDNSSGNISVSAVMTYICNGG